jgi:ubiquinone/menaquinone biosynthesis C-methylase UbiE
MTLEGKLHLAPFGNDPQRVLDIGTGTGNGLLSIRLFNDP